MRYAPGPVLACALALLMQLMLPYTAARALMSLGDPLADFVICAHSSAPEEAPAPPADAPRPHLHHCLLCQAMGGGALLPPPNVSLAAARLSVRRASWRVSRFGLSRPVFHGTAQSRGPPQLV